MRGAQSHLRAYCDDTGMAAHRCKEQQQAGRDSHPRQSLPRQSLTRISL